ncbi:class I SAM-dependent methyltransferase [Colwellia sp. 6_MG-2023]|uniref:class I SAM-dependent methyltransferase n=1 Tax=Colwellia sp. 6_MG-2023 TaxID=3062676 RepID=UPI0026E48492|nr:class I SAM-dependent methyltransferase [Colwellia sp. 6_MG-2023]MDO6488977.1 class I SAM-dependent methyltransferase [Colwellia sp. 6_MG-2023]
MLGRKDTPEFWENSFKEKQAMWGFEPTNSAKSALEMFKNNDLKTLLIPGFGYGRNAKIFYDDGFDITGIEISQTAIEIAKAHYGNTMKIYHGNVTDMPFDNKIYDGIFCYALIHLLGENERKKLIRDCYLQLKPNGYMMFVTISKNTATYGEGIELSKNRFTTKHGVNLFYYDTTTIHSEFTEYGLVGTKEMNESSQTLLSIICRKTL